jgi:hypothetical protein
LAVSCAASGRARAKGKAAANRALVMPSMCHAPGARASLGLRCLARALSYTRAAAIRGGGGEPPRYVPRHA